MTIPAILLMLALNWLVFPLVVSLVPGLAAVQYAPSALIVLGNLIVVLPILYALGWLRSSLFEVQRYPGRIALILFLVMFVYPIYKFATTDWDQTISADPALLLAILLSGVQAALWEELAFRGVPVTTLRARFSEVWVAVIASIAFGLMHLGGLTTGAPVTGVLLQVVFATFLGFGFYGMRRATGTLLVPMLLHLLNNVAATLPSSLKGGPFIDPVQAGMVVVGVIATVIVLTKGPRRVESHLSAFTPSPRR